MTEAVLTAAQGGTLTINNTECFSLRQTFDCGQCFRFEPDANGGFSGVAYGKHVRLHETGERSITIIGTDADDYENVWRHFLALDEDYPAKRRGILERFPQDAPLAAALAYGAGIRILHQEPWEALVSFIVSQNNNIPRIKKIIAALSQSFGEPFSSGGEVYYAFPTPEALYRAGAERIFSLKTGFRARYIFDAARRVYLGETDLCEVSSLPTAAAREKLCEIVGIGRKVADCTLLYGFGRGDVFPTDVWIKKVLAKYYPPDFEPSVFGDDAGLIQQYLFYYERYNT